MENKENPVKKVCRELGITQKELAEELGVTQNTVTNWVTGKVEIPKWANRCFGLLMTEKKFKTLKSIIYENLD